MGRVAYFHVRWFFKKKAAALPPNSVVRSKTHGSPPLSSDCGQSRAGTRTKFRFLVWGWVRTWC